MFFMLISFFFFMWAYLDIRMNITCPRCGKNLSYLVLDPSYSKTVSTVILPKSMENIIKECPFCKYNFSESGVTKTSEKFDNNLH